MATRRGAAAEWPAYVASFHARRPGITEAVLTAGTGDPYGWLAGAVPPDAGRVLDLACGSGPLTGRLSRPGYAGVDLSPAELALAAPRAPGRLLTADAARLPLADGSVDAVVSSMALQVLTPLGTVLDEVARVLRPGGRLVALLPASRPLTWRDRWRWGRLLVALRTSRLTYPNAVGPGPLRRAGLLVVTDEARRFGYPVRDAAAGALLVRSLYLPAASPTAVARAAAVAARWPGGEVGIPLRRLVAVRA